MTKHLTHLVIISIFSFFSTDASAVTEFNQDVIPEVIFGSGNANGSFTTSRNNGIELGLRAKIPFNGNINSSGDGKYSYSLADTDHDNNTNTPNRWNFDWTINTDYNFSNGSELSAYTYELGLDVDPSIAKNFLIFDPVTPTEQTPFYDHSFGNNTTGNGQGVETNDGGTYAELLFTQNVLQQSWRYSFFDQFPPMDSYDPSVAGTYHVYLLVRDQNNNVLARTEMVVEITNDGLITPEVIFGSGNTNSDFTIETVDGVEIGLRAKIPFSGIINNNGDGTYSYTLEETNHDNDDGTTPKRWNFDWAINTDINNPDSSGPNIGNYTYEIGLDSNPGLATDFFVFDPITPNTAPINSPFFDHAFGNNDTANGAGTVGNGGNYSGLLTTSNVVQQSWRNSFFSNFAPLDTYDPDVPGNYIVYLLARDGSGQEVARTEIQVLIGGAPKRTVPIAIDDYYNISEDSTILVVPSLGLLSNDADADMDTLSIVNPGAYLGGGIGGTYILYVDGGFEFTPPPNANGVSTLQYELTDGYHIIEATVTVNVNAVNDQPTFSILGNFELNSLDENSSTFIIDNFTFGYVFGPADESGQSVESIDLEVVSDSDGVLNEAIITNFGTLIFDLSLNYGTAVIEVVVKDDGSGDFAGNAFSDPIPFTISYLDLIFANGFDSVNGFKLLTFLDKITLVDQENATIIYTDINPYYDFPSNSINFLGHQYNLNDDFNSKNLIIAIYQWMEEIIHSEDLAIKIK